MFLERNLYICCWKVSKESKAEAEAEAEAEVCTNQQIYLKTQSFG